MPSVRRTPNGTRVVRAANDNTVPEWKLQAAGIRALRSMPEFGKLFTLAGDFNAARRSPREAVKAKATGLTAGEHDVRIYIAGANLGLIELKTLTGRLSQEQKARHALLAKLGFTRQAVIKVGTEAEAAAEFVRVVREWLAECAARPAAPRRAA